MPELTNVNVQMPDGVHYLTAVNGGGQPPQPQNGLATNQPGPPGPSETFSVEVIDPEAGTFALGTPDGVHFVTATDEGGIGEKADPAGLQPLHTDQADPALWESFNITVSPSTVPWMATIQCSDGSFITTNLGDIAPPGGGVGDGDTNITPIHTDAQSIGAWETFSLNQPWIYGFVILTFDTGSDDLSSGTLGRGPSSLAAEFTFADGTTWNLKPVNVNDTGDLVGFGENSPNGFIFQLPKPVTADAIRSVAITLVQAPVNFPAGPDQWDVLNLSVYLFPGTPSAELLGSQGLVSTFQLSGIVNIINESAPENAQFIFSAAHPTMTFNSAIPLTTL